MFGATNNLVTRRTTVIFGTQLIVKHQKILHSQKRLSKWRQHLVKTG